VTVVGLADNMTVFGLADRCDSARSG